MLEEAKAIEKQYEAGKSYKKTMGFLDKWPEYERFKAGDQWPKATTRTKNLPRPVFNIIDLTQGHKVSAVMSEQIKMMFTAEEMPLEETEEMTLDQEAADKFTKYSETTWEEIKQNEINEEALEDGSNLGTGIWHYCYDTSLSGGNNFAYDGKLQGETIDPINFFPGNPQQRKVQKQPYIIISYRDELQSVKEKAKDNGLSEAMVNEIQPDKDVSEEGYDRAKTELNDSEKVTVLRKYWRHNNTKTIWYTEVASGIVITPKVDMGIRLYPIVSMQWKRRKKSFFGTGDTEGLIPNQKAINFLFAMQILGVQLTAWPRLLFLEGSIDPTQIDNQPGSVTPVKNMGVPLNGAVQYMIPGQVPPVAQMLVDKAMEYSKEVSGTNETTLGEQPSGQLNATAIMLLQKSAGVPIEGIKRRFYQAQEDVGRIWEEFWKKKYVTERLIKVKDEDGNEIPETFRGSDYADAPLHLKIDIGPSSSFSETLVMSGLEKLYDKGAITTETLLKYAPKTAYPYKDRLLKDLEQDKLQNLNSTLMQMPEEIQKQAKMMLQQGSTPDQVMQYINSMMQQMNAPTEQVSNF